MTPADWLHVVVDTLGRATLIALALGTTTAALANLRRHYRLARDAGGTIAGEAWQSVLFAVVVDILALGGSGYAASSSFFEANGESIMLVVLALFGPWLLYKGHNVRVRTKTGAEADVGGKAET